MKHSIDRAPRPRGARNVVAMLPNGRAVWLELGPSLASLRDIEHVAAWTERLTASRGDALQFNGIKLQRLARRLKRGVAQATAHRLRANRKVLRRVVAGDRKLVRRISQSLLPALQQTSANQRKQQQLLNDSARRTLWNQLVVIGAASLMAGYGQRGSPFAEHNLVIAIAVLVWLFGDEVTDLFAGKRTLFEGPVRGTDLWSYTAPFANLLTGWWLLRGRQHERFITGTAVFQKDSQESVFFPLKRSQKRLRARDWKRNSNVQYVAVIDLSTFIAPEHFPDFQTYSNVPAVATLQSIEYVPAVDNNAQTEISAVLAFVEMGRLYLGISSPVSELQLKQFRVAWAVDTKAPPK